VSLLETQVEERRKVQLSVINSRKQMTVDAAQDMYEAKLHQEKLQFQASSFISDNKW
jgi:exoribonuclease R